MTPLKDLKDNILNNKLNNFYVFYGPDNGLKQHYINKIAESYKSIKFADCVSQIADSTRGKGLFKISKLYVIYNDVDFTKWRTTQLKRYIESLVDDCVILLYEEELASSNLFKNFGEYITYFPTVETKIALEFVDSEVSLSMENKTELARNCENNYSNICLEADKIRQYSEAKNVSNEVAYNILKSQDELIYKYPEFNIRDLMNDVLQGDFKSLGYWCEVTDNIYKDNFWIMLNAVFTDYLIAYCIQSSTNKYEGSSKAYNLGLPWGRCKEIREFVMPYTADYLYKTAIQVSQLDYMCKTGKVSQENLFNYFVTMII